MLVLRIKGISLWQGIVTLSPLVDGLEHTAGVLDVPEDAAVRRALLGSQAVKPVRVSFPSVLVGYGVIFVPPGWEFVAG